MPIAEAIAETLAARADIQETFPPRDAIQETLAARDAIQETLAARADIQETLAARNAIQETVPSRPEETRLVLRGVKRHLRRLGLACVEELPLASGRRADIVALGEDGRILIVEVKSSLEDFRVDQKWPFYRLHSDRLYFATSPRVPLTIFPEECGLIVADGFDAEILREAPEHRLSPATRKAMMIRFARAAALRLHGLADPGCLD